MKTALSLLTAALLAVLHSASAENPLESELFPPDFLLNQRETLGLNESQLQDIQAIVQDVQPKFENLKGQLEDRAKAFQEALHQAKPDVALTEDKLRAMLTQENEMKLLQVHLMLTLRSKLTPEQVDKARQLRAQMPQQAAANDPREGLPERLQKKFQQLKAAVEEKAAGGAPPDGIVKQVGAIQQLVQQGKPLEAERQLDQLLSELRDGRKKP